MRLSKMALLTALGWVLPALAVNAAPAEPPDDLDALSLADKAPEAPVEQAARPWRLFVEGAVGRGRLRGSGGDNDFGIYRGSIDFRYDAPIAPQWRVVLSDRLDGVDSDGVPPGDNVNTLREAYVSWSRTEHQIVDLGRVNVRSGAALGFNPTDWFKANALRSIVDPDPAVLRENRQGTVVLQAQQLWSEASLTATVSPKLVRTAEVSTSTFALNAGATNPSNRFLLAGSWKLSDKFTPQLLAFGGNDDPAQWGVNLSGLLGDAVVAFGEFTAGRGQPLLAQALNQPAANENQQRAALGLTYTTGFNLSLTAEADYSSAAPRGDRWQLLPLPVQQQTLATAQALQDLPTRSQWFVYANWKDLFAPRFELSGFLRQDMDSASRTLWLEGRYAWQRAELALQWQQFAGAPGTVYYAVPQQGTVQLILRVYL
ncbi:MAG TPA: hypothetical protein PLB41_17610 [Rubrivivax sp.]|nr:hypothetical protein [Rubrivivax sp.]